MRTLFKDGNAENYNLSDKFIFTVLIIILDEIDKLLKLSLEAGSFTSAIALLAHSSLSDDESVSNGGFPRAVISAWLPPALLPFLPASRFPDDIVTVKKQVESVVHISNYEQEPSAYVTPNSAISIENLMHIVHRIITIKESSSHVNHRTFIVIDPQKRSGICVKILDDVHDG
ncbi:conserved hypothetical protein [Trichinella spiralis]|uniref:hypothetical protein n=1 Tax=Trichinella spiralis TaxID=6334 RepID=UPI0001EFE433|nr:conserved hypothetical protein [Trichinella spiralis]